jgi:hypothetical protein
MSPAGPAVARGPGPTWFRAILVAVVLLYFILLFKKTPDHRWIRPVGFFTQATCLFPSAAVYAIEYRLAAWSCVARKWVPADRRAYFPMRAEDKESRFHRLAHFYKYNRTVMRALDDFVSTRHADVDDGVEGPIGGVRLFQILRPIPPPGSSVDRFVFEPLAPIPSDGIRDLYYTPGSERKKRCEAQR